MCKPQPPCKVNGVRCEGRFFDETTGKHCGQTCKPYLDYLGRKRAYDKKVNKRKKLDQAARATGIEAMTRVTRRKRRAL